MSIWVPREFKVFYGHQFYSTTELSSQTRNAISKAVQSAERSWNNSPSSTQVKLSFNRLDIDSGADIFDRVVDSINKSDICIFNLSEKNHNVIFELGHAHGKDKELIWVCNEAMPLEKLPSDFQGRYLVRYEDAEDLKDAVELEITKRVSRLLGGAGGRVAFEEIWNLSTFKSVDIVFGKIPKAERSKYSRINEPNYLRYQNLADIDTLVFLSRMFSRTFVNLKQIDYTPDTFRKEIDAPVILVGGPIWNIVARRYYQFPDSDPSTSPLPVYFAEHSSADEDIIFLAVGENTREFRVEQVSESLVYDVGLFAKFPEPYKHKPTYIISGIRTGGVLGAAKCFADTESGMENCTFIKHHDEDLSSFFALFRVVTRLEGAENIVETPNLHQGDLLFLDQL